MSVLDRVQSPADLKALSPEETLAYCEELRRFLIESVEATGGHLGSNLGVVELTVALHRVYDFAIDRLILDTSHQVYPHKVITGRRDLFPTLRLTDGLSGFMARGESPYDVFTSGHAGTAVSAAYGMACADALRGRADRRIVAVVGDAAAGAGATFEALNHAGHEGKRILVILNDNKWSIARTVGGLSKYLNRLRTLPAYREFKKDFHDTLGMLPLVGAPLARWAESVKEAVANYLNPGHLFRELGWTYFGPENGHDEPRLETLLRDLDRVQGPVLLHVVTEKGRGYDKPTKDACHAVAARPAPSVMVAPTPTPTRESAATTSAPAEPSAPSAKPVSYTKVFARAIGRAMADDPRVVAVTAAMPDGTGLAELATRMPDRVIDVGICEQHGVAFAGGLAEAGLRPVAAIYSTFLQRGYDQVWQEVVVQGLPVVFALDRAGIVGGDGVTHQGLYDIAYLRTFPGVTLMAPADPPELERMLAHALTLKGPSAVRYPRASDPDASLPGNDGAIQTGRGVLLRDGHDVALVAYGTMVSVALDAARRLDDAGIDAAVVNARFARPLDGALIERLARRVPLVITLEEHAIAGGFGEAVLSHLASLEEPVPAVVRVLGVPDRLVPHGDRADWLARFGLSAEAVAGFAVRECEAARALLVGDRRRSGVVAGVEAALPMLRARLDVVGVDLDERLDLRAAEADLVLVFGGDGAFLYVANRLGTNSIPVLGVNFGRLGWLAQLQPEGLEVGIDEFLAGRHTVTERARLRCTHRSDGEAARIVDEGLALNDVVVGRATLGKIVEIDVRIDGQRAITVAGDGLIVSTATGSTAHALSAGGPLLVPGLGAVVLVPICPHALGNRPLVVSRASKIEMVLGSERGPAVVTVDGREPRELAPRDTVEVTDAHAPLRVVSFAGRSYYDLLRERLGWKGRPEYRDRRVDGVPLDGDASKPASANAPAGRPQAGSLKTPAEPRASKPAQGRRPSKAK